MASPLFEVLNFEFSMELFRSNLEKMKTTIAHIYEGDYDSVNHEHSKLERLKRETYELAGNISPNSEEDEILYSELKVNLVELMSDYNNIYNALN